MLGLLVLFQFSYAQRTITGTVTDGDTENPLIGANIFVPNTTIGTISDFNGDYTIEVKEEVTQLQFSFIGYQAQIIDIDGKNTIDATLLPGQDLTEVVVIGYGGVKKEDLTGVVSTVSSKEFNGGAIVSPEQLLTGKIAGVQIIGSNGEPGGQTAIRIRGGTSISAGNEPLFVIDGIPIDNKAHDPKGFSKGRNPLNFLNPDDIETFTVLKDASAAAIYGSRGANGVILITTKKGKAGQKGKIDYHAYMTTSELSNDRTGMLNAEEFRNVVTFAEPKVLEALGSSNTDWYSQTLQDGKGQNHSLSFTGGAENLGYRLSGSYQEVEGIVKGSETQRTSYSANINQSLFNNKLEVNTSLKGAFTRDLYDIGVVKDALSFDPTQSIFDPSNTDFAGYFEYGNINAPRNPVSGIDQVQTNGKTFRNIGSLNLNYKFDDLINGLSAKLNMAYDVANVERKKFQPTTYLNLSVGDADGDFRSENATRTSGLLESYLNYKTNLGEDHSIDLTGGYSYQEWGEEYAFFRGINLNTDVFGIDNARAATEFENVGNTKLENKLISFFGRLNYTIKDRYLFTMNFRRDGSTRFGPNNRWGNFPSYAFGWRIMQEDFAAGLANTFSDLKLRVGYGTIGNQSIPDFRYLARYRFSTLDASYQFGDEFISTARPDGYDSGLKWEETTTLNLGLDFGIANGRINGSIEYYQKTTDDLLFIVNVPAGTNLTDRVLTNIGEVENKGIEVALDAYIINTADFSWNLGVNAAKNTNEVLAIDRVDGQGILTGGISGGVGANIQINQVGSPARSFFVFQHKLDASGNPLTDGIDYNEDGVANDADIYEDLNEDGMVNDLDKRVYENPAPDWILGLTSSMNFKGIDLGFTLRANLGNFVYNNNASNRGYYDRIKEINTTIANNVHESVLVTNFTRPQYFSDYYIEDASFLRMENMTLGYTIPNLPDGINLRLYATGQNLFTLTEYTGTDPEVSSGGISDPGIDNNPYPRARTFIFGLNLGL
ncbi:MAG: SusC/RagA family TonB-linked outer membrane protein [Chitinophagales bacterium]